MALEHNKRPFKLILIQWNNNEAAEHQPKIGAGGRERVKASQ